MATEPKARNRNLQQARKLNKRARELLEGDKYDEAHPLVTEVLRLLQGDNGPKARAELLHARRRAALITGHRDGPETELAEYDRILQEFSGDAAAECREAIASILVNKGTALDEADCHQNAIGVFDDVVVRFGEDTEPRVREQVGWALFNKGVVLNTLGHHERAIAAYDEVLTRFGEDTDLGILQTVAKALVNKGIALGEFGRHAEAVVVYNEVLTRFGEEPEPGLREPVARALLCAALEHARSARPDAALTSIRRLDELMKRAEGALSELVPFALSVRRLVQGPDASADSIARENALIAVADDQESQLRIYLEEIRRAIPEETRNTYFVSMESSGERTNAFLVEPSRFSANAAFLAVLREWNSYTPAVPAEEEQDRGGGYYLRAGDEGIVIDPGYDFVANFHRFGGRLADIDHIIVTHAHDDHTAELETLLMLLFQHTGKKKGIPDKRWSLYLSQDTQRKFSGILALRNPNINRLVTLCPGSRDFAHRIRLNPEVILTVLPAYHEDVITCGHAVGLGFEVDVDETKRRIVFTSDSGLYPWRGAPEDEVLDTDKDKVLYEQYPKEFRDVDLMIVHMGSIKKREFAPEIRDLASMDSSKSYYYGKHLGLLGTLTMLDHIQAKTAVVSEFGSELRTFHIELVQQIAKALHEKWKRANPECPRQELIVPGDLTILYDLVTGQPFCHETRDFRPADSLQVCPGPDYRLVWQGATKRYSVQMDASGRHRVYLCQSPALTEDEVGCAAEDAMQELSRYHGPIFRL